MTRRTAAGQLGADGRLHQAGERGQDVDRRVDLLVVELPVDEDLPLGDVARQIGDRMRDVWRSAGASRRSAPSLGMVRIGI